MNRAVIVVCGVLLMGSVTSAEPELSGSISEVEAHVSKSRKLVFLEGVAERTVESDRAVISMRISTQEKKFKDALVANTTKRTELVSKMTKAGIERDRIHVSKFSSTPSHGSWSGKVKTYGIRNTVRVEAESETELEVVAGLIDEIEGVALISFTFKNGEAEKIRKELTAESFAKLEEKKLFYEKTLGVALVPRQIGKPAASAARGGFTRGLRYFALDPNQSVSSMSGALAAPELAMMVHGFENRGDSGEAFDELTYRAVATVGYEVLSDK